MIRDGLLDLAAGSRLAQMPAYKGEGLAKGKPCKNLRGMFAYLNSAFICFCLERTKIYSVDDFSGKKIGLGSKGSLTSKFSEEFFETIGLKPRFFFTTPSEMIERLKDGLLDGSMYGPSHPWTTLQDLASVSKVRFLPFKEKYIDDFMKKQPLLISITVPANVYPNQPQEIKTFGSIQTIDVAASVPDEIVYLLVKTTWAHVEEIKKIIPMANSLDYETTMLYSIPLHPGALKYYREKGLKIPPHLFPTP
jgi:TRAP transporter TAXI family solute receptor